MSKRVFTAANYTPTATADATSLANNTYQALKGGGATNIVQVIEVMISGLAGSSSPTLMELGRASTLETTSSSLSSPNRDANMNPSALAQTGLAVAFAGAGTGPQRSAVDAKLELNLNTFGGIVRWQAAPGEEWWQIGNTAPGGESILSAFTGGAVGPVSSHIIYENLW